MYGSNGGREVVGRKPGSEKEGARLREAEGRGEEGYPKGTEGGRTSDMVSLCVEWRLQKTE